MEKNGGLVPLFCRGDIGGLTYIITNNIVNYLIVIATLNTLGWPAELIFGRVIPGMSPSCDGQTCLPRACGGDAHTGCGQAGSLTSSPRMRG